MKLLLATIPLLLIASPALAATSVPITVTMSEPVNVTGCPANCPRITLDVGGVSRYADFSAGSGTANLTFTYTTQAGDVDLDGITISSNAIDLNTSGTVKDLNGNNLSPLTFTIPNTSSVKVNHPSLSMDFVGSDYILNDTHYATLPLFLSAATGTFTRASIGTYFDSSGVMQTATAGTPRFDHDPVTHAAKGILIEEARTNYIRRGNSTGAVTGILGSGGALPSGWQPFSSVAGLTITVNGTGTENGLPYIEIRFSGTPTSTQSPNFGFETGSNISAASGQIWTSSLYHKLVAGNLTNVSTFVLEVVERNNVGTFLTSSISNLTPSATQTRTSVTRTFNNASTAQSNTKMNFNVTNGMPIDFTLRLYAIQQEQGPFATSYIPTTGTAVTRQSDNLNIPVGGWYNSTASTLYSEYSSNASVGYSTRIASFNEPTYTNVFQLADAAAGFVINQKAISGSIFSTTGTAYTSGTTYKIAGSLDSSSNPIAVNNVLYSSSNAGLPAGITRLHVGYQGASSYLNGGIKTLKYYPAHAADTQLQLLTQ